MYVTGVSFGIENPSSLLFASRTARFSFNGKPPSDCVGERASRLRLAVSEVRSENQGNIYSMRQRGICQHHSLIMNRS